MWLIWRLRDWLNVTEGRQVLFVNHQFIKWWIDTWLTFSFQFNEYNYLEIIIQSTGKSAFYIV